MLASEDDPQQFSQTFSQKEERFEDDSRAQFECVACHRFCFPHLDPRIIDVENCSHVLCGACSDRALAGEGPSRSCPECSARFSAKDVKPLGHDPANLRLLLGIEHGCPLECGFERDVQSIEAHLRTCPNARCDFCGVTVALPKTVVEHQQDECPRAPVRCRHAGCPMSVPRDNSETHEQFCDFKVIKCASPGCKFECRRKDMAGHRNLAMFTHLKLATERLAKAENKLTKALNDLAPLQTSLSHKDAEISRLAGELAGKKNDLLLLNASLAEKVAENGALKGALEACDAKAAQDRGALAAKDAEVARLLSAVKLHEASATAKEGEVALLLSAIKLQENGARAKDGEIARLRSAAKVYEDGAKAKDAEIARLRSAAKLHEDGAKVKDAKIATTQAELDRIRAELEQLRTAQSRRSIVSNQRHVLRALVDIPLPRAFQPPGKKQRKNPKWALWFPAAPVTVGPIDLVVNALITHDGLEVGVSLADNRVHHLRAYIWMSVDGQRYRNVASFESKQLLHHGGDFLTDVLYPVAEGEMFDRRCPIIFGSGTPDRYITLNVDITVFDVVLKGSEGPTPPTKSYRLFDDYYDHY
ncbi:hypothetical protein DFJ74DRAFT_704652 [Hyaloraphidium curvatum]|nr:hypothetical protein DFJ74DRAFT_704652 [Hyaloraphidium curvatum]